MTALPTIEQLVPSSQTLGLAFHELATNAAKYGALSVVSGETKLTWRLEPDHLVISWLETGGPAVEKPASTGFGMKTILAAVERQLHGHVEFDWRKEGLRCILSIPRDERMLTTSPVADCAKRRRRTQRQIMATEIMR